MRLGLQVLLFIVLTTRLFATTTATANAYCVTTQQTQSSESAAAASCFSNASAVYSAFASGSAFTVNASASSNPATFGFINSGASAHFEGDYILTILGGVGSGGVNPSFSYQISTHTVGVGSGGLDETATLQASINGSPAFYAQNDHQLPSDGGSIPFTFDQPIFLHIQLDAIVVPSGHRRQNVRRGQAVLSVRNTLSLRLPNPLRPSQRSLLSPWAWCS
jgi:hypothetical protein